MPLFPIRPKRKPPTKKSYTPKPTVKKVAGPITKRAPAPPKPVRKMSPAVLVKKHAAQKSAAQAHHYQSSAPKSAPAPKQIVKKVSVPVAKKTAPTRVVKKTLPKRGSR